MSVSDKNAMPGDWRAWASIAVIVVLVMLGMIDRNSINLMIDPIRQTLGIDDFYISFLQGPAFAATFLIGSLAMGWLTDRYSNRWLLYIGVSVWSLATVASGFSDSFVMLAVARGFVGLGESVLQPAGWALVTRLFPAHRLATAIGTLTAGSQLGVAASFLITGFVVSRAGSMPQSSFPLIGPREPWQWVFILTGAPGLLLALLVFMIAEKRNPADGQASVHTAVMPFVKKEWAFLACHFLGFGLLSVLVNGAAAWGPTYLMRTHGMSVQEIGLLLGFVGVPLGIGGVLVAGWLVDRSFKKGQHDAHFRHFAVRSVLVAVLGAIGFTLDQDVWVPLVCFSLIQFIQPFSGVAGAALQVGVPEALRGRISAIFIMFYNAAGLMLGPGLVALVGNWLGKNGLGTALAMNYLILASLAAGLLWTGRRYGQRAYVRYGARRAVAWPQKEA
jgi:MFS family permease